MNIRVLLFLVLLLGGFTAARAQDAAPSDPGPEQPIPFSHKQHVQVAKAACTDCHTPSKTGAALLIPQANTCMLCHAAIAKDKPAIKQVAEYAKSGESIPWVRVYQVPSFVSFSHKLHGEHGNTCEECHGPVGTRDVVRKETDISMGGCIGCHQKKNAAATCDTCHQLQDSVRNHVPYTDADRQLLARLGLGGLHPGLKSASPAVGHQQSVTAAFSRVAPSSLLAVEVGRFLQMPPL